MKNSDFKIIILSLIIGVSGMVGVNYVLAQWSSPNDTPPTGNVHVPVNVGGAPQEKAGGLWVGTGLSDTQTSFVARFGKVGIGRTSPDSLMHLSVVNGVSTGGVNDLIQRLEIDRSGANVGPAMDFVSKTADGSRWTRALIKGSAVNTDDQQGNLSFYTRPSSGGLVERMRITSTGNINVPSNAILTINNQQGTAGQVLTRVGNGMAWQTASGGDGLPSGSADSTLRHDGNGWVSNNNFKVNNAGSLVAGSIPWARLTNFPTGCPSGQFVRAVGSTLTCETPSGGGGGNKWAGADNQTGNIGRTGSVGIGTNSPSTKLHIKGSDGSEGVLRIDNNTAGQQSSVSFADAGNRKFVIGKQTNNNFFMWNGDENFDFLEANRTGPLTLRSKGALRLTALPSVTEAIIDFRTGGLGNTSRMIVSQSGRVGIGENLNPNAMNRPFAVLGSPGADGSVVFRTFIGGGENKYSAWLDLMTTATGGGSGDPNGKSWSVIARANDYGDGESNDLLFSFHDTNWTEGMRLRRNGNVYDLRVTGDVYARGQQLSSDLNLKTNINTLSNSLAKVLDLRGVSFNWKDRGDDSDQIGFIAQEVEKIFPESVRGEEGSKSVSYTSLVPVLVEAVKELDAKNKELEARLEKLEKRLGVGF